MLKWVLAVEEDADLVVSANAANVVAEAVAKHRHLLAVAFRNFSQSGDQWQVVLTKVDQKAVLIHSADAEATFRSLIHWVVEA